MLNEDKEVTFIINSRNENIPFVGISINSLCRHLNFSEQDASKVELSIVETISNAIKHSYKNDSSQEVKIIFKHSSNNIEIDIINRGLYFKPAAVPELDIKPEDPSTFPDGGLGLFLIFAIMDEVEIFKKDGMNVWRLTKKIPDTEEDNNAF